MRPPGEIWRQRLWIWVPALLFFLANATAFAVYRFGYAERVASLQESSRTQQATGSSRWAQAQAEARGAARALAAQRAEIEQLYTESFSTRKQRMTDITAEVKTLARKAGLEPKSFSYPEQEIQRYGLIKRSFIFSVEGTYRSCASSSTCSSVAIVPDPRGGDLERGERRPAGRAGRGGTAASRTGRSCAST